MKNPTALSLSLSFILFLGLSLSSVNSIACGSHLSLSAPHMTEHEALIEALNNSQGKKPKPFTFKDLQESNHPNNDEQYSTHDHQTQDHHHE